MSFLIHSHFKSLLAGLLLAGALAQPARAAGPPRTQDAGRELVPRLREQCSVQTKLYGALVLPVPWSRTEGGKLLLKGYVDTLEQKKEVEKAAEALLKLPDLLKDRPDLPKLLENGISAEAMQVVPVRSEFLKALQKDFAEKERPPGDQRTILRETRLDTVYYKEGKETGVVLVFQGVCTASPAGLPRDDNFASALRETIVSASRSFFQAPEYADLRAACNNRYNAERVRLTPWSQRPTVVLQRRASEDRKLDGALFRSSWYDKDGQLQIDGLVPKVGDRKKIEAIVEEELARNPEEKKGEEKRPLEALQLAFGPKGKMGRAWSLDKVVEGREPIARKAPQRWVAQSGDLLLRSVRIDRWHYAYVDDRPNVLQLRVNGISIGPDFDEWKDKLSNFLRAKARAAWPELFDVAPAFQVSPEEIGKRSEKLFQPRALLQKKIATVAALDGAGINAGAYFDEDGKLCLRGVWRVRDKGDKGGPWGRQAQEAELRKVVGEVLKTSPLVRDGVAFKLSELRTDEVLQGLREWTADALEDAYVERLYFDDAGLLTIEGFCISDDDAFQIKAKLRELIGKHPQMKRGAVRVFELTPPDLALAAPVRREEALAGPRPPPVRALRVAPPDDPSRAPGYRLDVRSGRGIAAQLRRLVQQPRRGSEAPAVARKWDGVLIRRGYYAPDGSYGLVGLISGEAQRRGLAALLKEPARRAEWGSLVGRADLRRLKIVPVAPMVARMQLVFPSYPTFDGIQVDSAAHDVDQKLILRIAVVGTGPSPRALALTTTMLLEHESWRERVEGGLRWLPISRQHADETDAYVQLLGAISTLRLGMLQPFPTCDTGFTGLAAELDAKKGGATRPKAEMTQEERIAKALGMLDVSLLHNPRDATAWYLRATCHLLRKDTLLAERDMRRLLRQEDSRIYGDAPVRRGERLRLLEPLQGDVRRNAEKVRRKVEIDILSGKPPLRLAP